MLGNITVQGVLTAMGEFFAPLIALLKSFAIWYETSLDSKSKQDIKAAQAVIDNAALKDATDKEINALSDQDLATRTVND